MRKFFTSLLALILSGFAGGLVAQFTADPPAAVGKTGMWSPIVFVALLVLLIGLILCTDSRAAKGDIPMVLGLGLPGLVTILVQWVFVRWRVKRDMVGGKAG